MVLRCVKCLLVATFSLFFASFFNVSFARENGDTVTQKKRRHLMPMKSFSAIFQMRMNFIFLSYKSGGKEHEVTIPLPVILYSPQRGVSLFMSSKFEHGNQLTHGYFLLTNHSIQEWKLDPQEIS